MPISSLRVTNFRNLAAVDLAPVLQGLNILSGNNGSGKTSLLEAIHFLGHGRSFRESTAGRLIRHTMPQFSLFTQLINEERSFPLGIERQLNGSTRLRVAEKEEASMAELAALLPLRLINSQSHHLFESGPAFRRKYLDWGLFYQAPSFLACWRHFERALKQRNIILKNKHPHNELAVWSSELAKYGLELDRLRRDYINQLTPLFIELAEELLGISEFNLEYYPGWDESFDFNDTLARHYLEEYRSGCSQFGPQRADLNIKMNTLLAKHFLSRGQQKLLICAMMLAQGKLLERETKKGVIYLIDDLPSELDEHSKNKLISLLIKQRTQIFITAIQSETICNFIAPEHPVSIKVFHVEHGNVEARDSNQ